MTEQQIESMVERFFELMGEDELTPVQEEEVSRIIHSLGLTQEDLRDLAAQCARRAIYLNNTQQPA
jgi:hypothetical protein